MKKFNKQIIEAVERGLQRGLNLSVNDFNDTEDILDNNYPTIYQDQDGYIKKQIKNDGMLYFLYIDLYKQANELQFNYKTLKDAYLLKGTSYKYIVNTKLELQEIVWKICKVYPEADLNWIDTHKITSLHHIFANSKFNGDISEWDVSNVKDMSYTFLSSQFNGDISKWDVSSVENMDCLFAGSQFNQDISNWDISSVKNMRYMFYNSKFNQDISNWNTQNVTKMNNIFNNCPIKEEYKPKPVW